MRHQKLLLVIGICILGLCLVSLWVLIHIIGNSGDQNIVTTGRVRITMQELEEERQEELQVEYIRPGACIPIHSVIKVGKHSHPAYLRVQVVARGLNESLKRELLRHLQVGDGWIWNEQDGQFYYQEKVKEGDQILFCKEVEIPESWGALEQSPAFQFELIAEAVEATYLAAEINESRPLLQWEFGRENLQLKSDAGL